MHATHQIVVEADTVTEARHRAERRVPHGMQVVAVRESWPHTGTVRAGGEDPTSATEKARAQLPAGAIVIGEMVRPVGEVVYVYAVDEQRAAERLRATYGDALASGGGDETLGLALSRTAGPFGHSNGLAQFRTELRRPLAEISYKTKARVVLTFGLEPLRGDRPRWT